LLYQSNNNTNDYVCQVRDEFIMYNEKRVKRLWLSKEIRYQILALSVKVKRHDKISLTGLEHMCYYGIVRFLEASYRVGAER